MAVPVYKQPYVEKGMSVLWTQDGSFYHPAKAISVNQNNSVDVLVFYPEGNTQLKDGIRHKTDPCWKDANAFHREQGMWEHTEFNKRILSVLNDLAPTKTEQKKAG